MWSGESINVDEYSQQSRQKIHDEDLWSIAFADVLVKKGSFKDAQMGPARALGLLGAKPPEQDSIHHGHVGDYRDLRIHETPWTGDSYTKLILCDAIYGINKHSEGIYLHGPAAPDLKEF